ncbi:retropepsin-like aspartic protease [Aquisphaera giovannonii]|uniref:retropepsin-like aspartic protease n=1 Tax=Aquisphaera giovannonii TaxID=406548 RepID=UPI00143DEE05|nr:retropepsin-like aspartic protease [Aquisphaera giovannonii]
MLSLSSGVLGYTAASGESNKLAVAVVQVSGTSYIRFQDTGAGVTISPQGTDLIADSATSVRAPAASVTSISIDTENQTDSIRLALGVGMPASISVNLDPPPDANGVVTLPAYGQDQLTIVGPNGADTLALTPQLAPDATKEVVLADTQLGSKVALQHIPNLTVDLSASSGQHAVTVDRSITRPDAPIALKVIGGPAGGDTLTVTAPGTIAQTFALADGSIKTSDVRTGKEIMLGPDDNIAIDQPGVSVNLELDPANPDATWPSLYNQFVLDTGATSILAAADASTDLKSSGLYQVYPTQYLEQGVGGYTAMDVSHPYGFDFAGTNGIPHHLDNVQILSSDTLQFSPFGPDGIAGMPAMVNRFTSIDMSGWENPQDLTDFSIKTDFPTGTSIPTNSGHWYQVPVNLVNFPDDGRQPGGPAPTSAPLAMVPVTVRDNGREVTSYFLLDTGAQLSMVSPSVAQALNIDLSHPSDTIDVGGVGGTVAVPLVPVDQLDVKAANGTSLAWTNLQVGVLDLNVPGGPTIGGVFGMDFLTSGWAAKILPMLLGQPGSSENGYFDHVYLDYRNASSGAGTIIFDVDPSHDTPAVPDPHPLSVSYSSIAAVHAVGGGGSDLLSVTPSTTIAYTVDGGTQPSGGADTLQLIPGNSQAVANGSTITVPGDKAINYANIEELILGSTSGAATATFVKQDATTQGTWINAYGKQGYDVIGGSAGLPGYATVTPSGQSGWTWAAGTTDVRALQAPGTTSRIAACWYSGSSFKVDVNLTDGQKHGLGLYFLDWDSTGRAERVQISDAATGAVLSTQSIASFHNGLYLDYTVSGHVRITITRTGGANAVLSGLFLDPPPMPTTATFVKQDATTQGTWINAYGKQGYDVIGGSAGLPGYATVTPSGQSGWTWAAGTTDVRALQAPGTTSRIAACWYSGSSFKVDVNLTDGQKHGLGLYFLDWDSTGRAERVQISDAATGAVLSTQSIASFHNGLYLDYTVSGHVRITITRTGGANAVLSGLFLDPPPTTTASLASGISAPTFIMTPRMLDATLRTAVLTRPVNRFERMLVQIAALRRGRLSTPQASSAIPAALPAIATPPEQRPGDRPPGETRTGDRTAGVDDPVQDEALSQIMALDPIFPKSRSNRLFSSMPL